ncbi:uncharacterized protein LOC122820252 [Gambusia affinis]|uniref:uncharacterized protein LOC122820252 n=1 Tax=Gambusia affinis TaxID=33528 RepID=UPI001CDBF505|nr:uncharacterized protein LOC122820252 [Gambusia affinis]
MARVQVELRESELSSDLGKDYQMSYLLEAILVWLNSSDRNMEMLMTREKTCMKCKGDLIGLFNSSPLVALPSIPAKSITSLFSCWLEFCRETRCSVCKSVFNRKNFLSNNEAIALFRPLSARCWNPILIPSATLDVPGKGGSQTYHLSSIICSNSKLTHFYTFLIRGQQMFMADDDLVMTPGDDCKKLIQEMGFVYIYEKETASVTSYPAVPLQSRGRAESLKDAENKAETISEAGEIILKDTENVFNNQKYISVWENICKNISKWEPLLLILCLFCMFMVVICFCDFFMLIFFLISVCGLTYVSAASCQELDA